MASTLKSALRRVGKLVGHGALTAAVCSGVATAEENATALALEEVVVTAHKCQTTEQRTAVAITVLGQEALDQNGVRNLADMISLVPAVNFSQNSLIVVVSVRGISSRDTSEIGDPAVSISQDGFYIQRPIGLADSIYDLERVEVLRGPQGTLYGSNATGGAMKFITAQPTDQFGAKAALTVGKHDLVTAEGMVNLPLTDTLQTHIAVYSRQRDGYRTNEAPAEPGYDADANSGRIQLAEQESARAA